jgi:hypothetical protein
MLGTISIKCIPWARDDFKRHLVLNKHVAGKEWTLSPLQGQDCLETTGEACSWSREAARGGDFHLCQEPCCPISKKLAETLGDFKQEAQEHSMHPLWEDCQGFP